MIEKQLKSFLFNIKTTQYAPDLYIAETIDPKNIVIVIEGKTIPETFHKIGKAIEAWIETKDLKI